MYPLEACGVMLGKFDGATGVVVHDFVPVENAAQSAKIYELDGRQFSKAALNADKSGLDIVGVVHSHTHTVAYPSATDVAEGTRPVVPPQWHWPILSLAGGYPELRSFQFVAKSDDKSDGQHGIVEEPVRFLQ